MERFEPSVGYHAWYEHWHRYHWVRELAADRTVVDIACGEGYGSDLLAQEARRVLGIDVDRETLAAARARYPNDRLDFLQGSAERIPLADDCIDLLVSFETLEHLHGQEDMVAEIARVIHDRGLAVISTPDREIYSPDGVKHNDHHVKELDAQEFHELLAARFPHIRTFGQDFQLFSTISELTSERGSSASILYADAAMGSQPVDPGRSQTLYRIAVCGFSEEVVASAQLSACHAFSDVHASLWKHYEAQVKRLQDVDQALEEARRELRESRAAAAHLAARLGF